jgi:predicted nucleic acid-binding protein
VEKLERVVQEGIPFGINRFIYQEILQGAGSEKKFILLKTCLDTQIFYALRKGRESFSEAVKNYFRCREAGITVKSTMDLILVQTALENNLAFLHNDSDFTLIQKVVPEPRIS